MPQIKHEDNVFPLGTPPKPGGNGGNGNFGERLATLEERMNHLATTADLERVQTALETRMARMEGEFSSIKKLLYALVGILFAGLIKYIFFP